MIIDITEFFNSGVPELYSASVAEIGPDAGKITWNYAKDDAKSRYIFLRDEEQLTNFKEHVKGFGAWEAKEICSWGSDDCNAAFLQLISGDIREAVALCSAGTLISEYFDWGLYEMLSRQGTLSGSLYKGDDGLIYYYVGS